MRGAFRRVHSVAKEGFAASNASAYEAGRPEYDVGLLRLVLREDLRLSEMLAEARAAGRALTVVDLGAGTGKFSRSLLRALREEIGDRMKSIVPGAADTYVGRGRALTEGRGSEQDAASIVPEGVRLFVVEPSGMGDVLHSLVPGARVLRSGSEAVPLISADADIVCAGQAFHWCVRIESLSPRPLRLTDPPWAGSPRPLQSERCDDYFGLVGLSC